MAGKKRGGDKRPDNVVSLFGSSTEGPTLAVDMTAEEAEKVKDLMVGVLESVIKSVRSGETTGIVVIGMRTKGEYGAETYLGGPGVFENIDRTIGIMELVKLDLAREAGRVDG